MGSRSEKIKPEVSILRVNSLSPLFLYCQGIGVEMERLAERMGGTRKWPYNDSECLDADFFKVDSDAFL